MEAGTKERQLSGEKAQRIVDAMRDSVARRGAAGSTFEHVAREVARRLTELEPPEHLPLRLRENLGA